MRGALRPVPGSPGARASILANSAGQFTFANLPAGAYFLTASRKGFAPFKHGQKSYGAAAVPVTVEPDGKAFIDIRLQRFGAFSAGSSRMRTKLACPIR